jgi:rRNA maturation endonuclease Nob1
MVTKCKNQCQLIKGARNHVGHTLPGNKKCIACEMQFPYDGVFCPCCGGRVRNNPRYKGKKKYDGVRY